MKIKFENVSFKYEDNQVINDLSFELNSGEMVSIIGHNGSGKSTISKLIVGLLEADAGNIYIDDILLNDNTVDKLRLNMGIIFQNPDNQFVGVTVKDDIAFGLENRRLPRNEMIEKINKYSKMVNMHKFLEANPEELSGGQKQRVAIAGILAMETETIIFDEATSMLDPLGTKEINETIKQLKQENDKTIITITHNLEEAIYSDRIIVLKKGKIVADGKPEEILKMKEILESSGLNLLDSLEIYNKVLSSNNPNKEKICEALWELTFKI